MEDDYEFVRPEGGPAALDHVITVLGIGGCGNKTVDHMISVCGENGIKYVSANSDKKDLHASLAPTKILLGPKSLRGRGCGADPELGRAATEEVLDEIKKALAGTELLFIAAGMGGGTGSGGAPVVAQAMSAMEDPPLVVSVVTTPFSWERQRHKISDKVVAELTQCSNSIITVSNAKMETFIAKDATLHQAMAAANEILQNAVHGIIELLALDARIHLDFGDVSSVLSCRGPALMGYGEASGDSRAKKALQNAITCPLMTDHSIRGARKLIVNIVTGNDFTMEEYSVIMNEATKEVHEDGMVFGGWAIDDKLDETGALRVTVIATGLYNDDAWAVNEPWTGQAQVLTPETEVVELDTIVNDQEQEVLLEPVQPAPPRQTAPRPAAPAAPPVPRAQYAAKQQAAYGVPQQTPYAPAPQARPPRDPSAGVLGTSPRPRRPAGPLNASSGQPQAAVTRYESNAGVDPMNKDIEFYAKPPFLRNKAS
ncbi:MAG: cell division FtsZ family protein [Deltaproteobacteria bacterium]|jgi:cell division protein FtsZ|nr:cell division FtsZ family protein [Deltaproteobacteria bacterium]